MAKKRRGKRRQKAALYQEENYNGTHTEYVWYDSNSKEINFRETALYDNRYLEFFHPYHLMKALNCKKRV